MTSSLTVVLVHSLDSLPSFKESCWKMMLKMTNVFAQRKHTHLLMIRWKKKVGLKVKKTPVLPKRKKVVVAVKENKKVIGLRMKINVIIYFCKSIINISSTGRWGDLIRYSSRWPSTLVLVKPNSVEVTIRKWKKNLDHFLRFYVTSANSTTTMIGWKNWSGIWRNSLKSNKISFQSRKFSFWRRRREGKRKLSKFQGRKLSLRKILTKLCSKTCLETTMSTISI